MSSFSWLDYSEHDRRRMLDVIQLFKEKDTRDELGTGSIRDGLADLLFPGVSTIQTRARYFFIVPWIYLDLERKRSRKGQPSGASYSAANRGRAAEIAVIKALIDSAETEGVIGQRAREKLQRLPSNIYWQGLRVLGIRSYPGAQDQYHRLLDRGGELTVEATRDDDGLVVERRRSNWHPGLPPAPAQFPKALTLALTQPEALYLQERIVSQTAGSLFAFLAAHGKPVERLAFPWEHPQRAEFGPRIQEQLRHAQNFSEAIHGAALLYNLLLAEASRDRQITDFYRQHLLEWAGALTARRADYAAWDLNAFWTTVRQGNPRIPDLTKTFVDHWLHLALPPARTADLGKNPAARELVANREAFLKRDLARLRNQRNLDLWRSAGAAAGTGRIDFRWGNTQTHLADIFAGLDV